MCAGSSAWNRPKLFCFLNMASTKATWSRLIQRLGGVLDLASAAMNRYTAREPLMLAFPFWSASR